MPSVSFASGSDAAPRPDVVVPADVATRRTIRPHTLHVKNTFLSYKERSPSLDGFYEERQTQSCPSSPVRHGHHGGKSHHYSWAAPGVRGVSELDLGSSCSTVDTAATPSTAPSLGHEDAEDRPDLGRGGRRTRTWAAPLAGADPPERPRRTGVPAAQAPTAAWAGGEAERAVGPQVLRLEQALAAQQIAAAGAAARPVPVATPWQLGQGAAPQGSVPLAAELPSIGSAGHAVRQCKPCAFVTTSGCSNGINCEFCHLCEPGEKKRRQKEKRAMRSAMREMRSMRRLASGGSSGAVASSSARGPTRPGFRTELPQRMPLA